MKKIRFALAIILILSCLLSVLSGCASTTPGVEEETEKKVSNSTENIVHVLTEKDKENIFVTAMNYLTAKNFDAAYDEFLKIPDYKIEGNLSVAEYLARFNYKHASLLMFTNDNVDYTYKSEFYYDDYGYHTSFLTRNASAKDVTPENEIKTRTYENGVLVSERTAKLYFSYTYVNGLVDTYNEHASSSDTSAITYTTKYSYDSKNRLTNLTKIRTADNATLYTIDYFYNDDDLLVKTIETKLASSDVLGAFDIYASEENGWFLRNETVDGVLTIVSATVTNYEYDEAHNLVKESGAELVSRDTTPHLTSGKLYEWYLVDYTIDYTYNNKNQLVKEEKKYNEAAAEQRITVSTIDTEAFLNKATITSVSIPNTIKKIDKDAFKGCSALTDIYFYGTEAQWNAIDKAAGVIPAGVNVNFVDPTTKYHPTNTLAYTPLADGTYKVSGKGATEKTIGIPATCAKIVDSVSIVSTYAYDDLDRLFSITKDYTNSEELVSTETYYYENYSLYYDPYQ